MPMEKEGESESTSRNFVNLITYRDKVAVLAEWHTARFEQLRRRSARNADDKGNLGAFK